MVTRGGSIRGGWGDPLISAVYGNSMVKAGPSVASAPVATLGKRSHSHLTGITFYLQVPDRFRSGSA